MNSPTSTNRIHKFVPRSALGCLAAIAATFLGAAHLQAQSDNFDTNTTTLGFPWKTSASTHYPANILFPTDDFGGKSLRMWATTNDQAQFAGAKNTSRVFAWVTNRIYTNFYVAADLVAWNTSMDRFTNNGYVGLFAHLTNDIAPPKGSPSFPVGRPNLIGLGLHINRWGGTNINADGTPNGTRGNLDVLTMMYGMQAPDSVALVARCEWTLNPGHKYRLVWTGSNILNEAGTVIQNQYRGRVYDLNDLTRPLASVDVNEIGYPSGNWSQVGWSGIFGFGTRDSDGGSTPETSNYTNPVSTDVTFDNFVASEYPPTSVNPPGTPHGLDAVPQVVNRQPASWTNFYPAALGISFNATTLTDTNTVATNAIKLFLNGVDVSSGLSITGTATNASVSYSGLTSNAVYFARIELKDALNRKTTNEWTFDTFSDTYLASAGVKIIECEDFDFNGQFIDDPITVSGYDQITTYSNNTIIPLGLNTDFPWAGVINQGATSYVLKPGVNAETNGGSGDFRDGGGKGDEQFGSDYRPLGSIGTCQGQPDYVCYDMTNVDGYTYRVAYDTQRSKYSSVNPDLQEYFVNNTRGEEWIKYTRVFQSTNYYNVYLRYGCALAEDVSLDQIGAGPTTNHLGTFGLTSAFAQINVHYAPLRDNSGKLAVVNLSGTNTLRLFMSGSESEKFVRGLVLNYMAFVPALLVESSSQVNTGYTVDTTASVDLDTQKIIIPQSGAARFYRLRWDHAVTITSVKVSGSNVELTYQ